MSSVFGWNYPPGAEHDPFAPWNQPEQDEDWSEKDDTDPDDEESEAE